MSFSLLSSPLDLQAYREWVKNSPHRSLWQSLEWKGYQEALGRETRLYGLPRVGHSPFLATTLVIIDRTAFGFSTWDIPRGPLGEGRAVEELLAHVVEEAKRDCCMALYFSPPVDELKTKNYQPKTSLRGEQPEATIVIDPTQSDDELLAQMQEKGRYNIRLAQRHAVRVEKSEDIGAFYALLKRTAERDSFQTLPKAHYECFLKSLPGSFLLLAYPPSPHYPITGLLGVVWGKTGYYYYGASDYAHRALMAPYLLQWEAMQLCRARGCTEYDLLGIAPEGAGEGHPWAGLTRFKKQFGGKMKTYPEEKMIMLRPAAKRLIEWKRRVLG